MQKLFIAAAAAAILPLTAAAQDAKAYLGRWDMTVKPATGNPYPQWMELAEKNGKIEGRVQPRGGGWRPILGAIVEPGKIVVNVAAAGRGPAIRWELKPSGPDSLRGVEKRGENDGPSLAGVRA